MNLTEDTHTPIVYEINCFNNVQIILANNNINITIYENKKNFRKI